MDFDPAGCGEAIGPAAAAGGAAPAAVGTQRKEIGQVWNHSAPENSSRTN